MKTKLSTQDWQALSAYLDGQLAPKQRHRLERRLKDNPALQDALDGLRHTRSILRSQPKLRAPRNFTLTPEMAGLSAGLHPQPGAYPVLRLASVLATIFFVFLFAGEVYITNFGAAPLQMDQNAAAQKAAPWLGVGSGGGGGGAEAEEALALPVEEPMAAVERSSTPESEEKLAEPSLDMATAVGSDESPLPEVSEGGPTLLEPPEAPVLPAPTFTIRNWPILRVFQIILAVLAVGAGLAALFVRRSLRR